MGLNTTAYGKGIEAAYDDELAEDVEAFHDNPYAEGSHAHEEWNRGYASAMEHIRLKQEKQESIFAD